jgi:deazaflavin-dependent oxidoreductase (nitroreductase family)
MSCGSSSPRGEKKLMGDNASHARPSLEPIPHPRLRQFFRPLNRYFMVPLFRMGLGSLLGSPYGGYVMVLKTIGHKTGQARYTPVNYAISDGNIYCLAGWRRVAHWYRNLGAHPKVELIMPAVNLAGTAEEVTDSNEWLRMVRQISKNAGFAGFLLGANPFTASDETIRDRAMGTPVIRIRPTGIGSGSSDPGGWLWVLVAAASLWLVFFRNRGRTRDLNLSLL